METQGEVWVAMLYYKGGRSKVCGTYDTVLEAMDKITTVTNQPCSFVEITNNEHTDKVMKYVGYFENDEEMLRAEIVCILPKTQKRSDRDRKPLRRRRWVEEE